MLEANGGRDERTNSRLDQRHNALEGKPSRRAREDSHGACRQPTTNRGPHNKQQAVSERLCATCDSGQGGAELLTNLVSDSAKGLPKNRHLVREVCHLERKAFTQRGTRFVSVVTLAKRVVVNVRVVSENL